MCGRKGRGRLKRDDKQHLDKPQLPHVSTSSSARLKHTPTLPPVGFPANFQMQTFHFVTAVVKNLVDFVQLLKDVLNEYPWYLNRFRCRAHTHTVYNKQT